MQTFLPFPDYKTSAQCLDYRRLGKQRVEAYQILKVLSGQSKGWSNHPAVKMWKGSEHQLAIYGLTCCEEWLKKGYKDSLTPKIRAFLDLFLTSTSKPSWMGNNLFHASHRSNLLRKDPNHYGKLGWTEPDNLPYIWPL